MARVDDIRTFETSHFAEESHLMMEKTSGLSRAQTLPLPSQNCVREAQFPPNHRAIDNEFAISPVPSLASSSGSGSSNWPSGNLSPVPSPLPMFVSNDPSTLSISALNTKYRVANLVHADTIICDTSIFDYRGRDGREEAVFDMRVGNYGQEVY